MRDIQPAGGVVDVPELHVAVRVLPSSTPLTAVHCHVEWVNEALTPRGTGLTVPVAVNRHGSVLRTSGGDTAPAVELMRGRVDDCLTSA